MTVRIVVLLLFICAAVAFSDSAIPRCEKISTSLCQHLGYNTTMMPNFMGHEDQRDAASGLEVYKDLLNHNCSSFLRLFVCSVFVPLCSEHVPGAIPACRGLCEEVKRDCFATLQFARVGWPAEFDCSKFPEPPNLCMQQPSEDDLKDVSSEHFHSFKNASQLCSPGSVLGSNRMCLKKCDNNDTYSYEDKRIYSAWSMFWTFACLIITTFTLQTFLTQPKRFRWPARPILYLSFCGFIKAVVYLIRWIVGPFICLGATVLEKPTDSLGCTSVALLIVYLDVATTLWWTIFCFVWYLSAAKEWSTEALEKISAKLHAFAWALSTIPLVFILITRDIRLDELTGFCEIFCIPLTIVQLCVAGVGCCLAAFTSVALKNVRRALMYEGRSPFKLERLILRLGIISLGICVCTCFSLICNFFDNFYVTLLKISLQFLGAIISSSWVFSSKTFKNWNKILRPKSCQKILTHLPSTKV